jgi:hypothetical protein
MRSKGVLPNTSLRNNLRFKSGHAVDCIKEAKKAYSFDRTAEGLSEISHKIVHLLLLVLVLLTIAASPRLPLAEGLPSKPSKLFVTCAEQTNVIQHLCKEACGVRPTAKTKEVYVVLGSIIGHEKLVASHNMVGKVTANRRILRFVVP